MEAKKLKKLTPTQEKSRKKKLVEIVKDLQSSEDVVVLDALEKVKEHGDASVIPHLVSIYKSNENLDVQKSVKNIFVGLKDQETIPALLEEIKNSDLSEEQCAFLTSVFWEAGFNVNAHLNEFIELALSKGMLTCIEVMTIIENMESPDRELVEQNMLKLKREYDKAKSEKDALYLSILEILNDHLIG